jgi:4-amino-4-deoxy-L-arabinose transferase-like glycosyltransferase
VFSASGRWLLIAAAIYLIYFFGLTEAGLIGPDEPRYSSIAREMARSGDWVTPVLWGQPWFEKPPLLYWMTAAASRLGLGEDLGPRLPVALMSVAFLLLYYRLLRAEFGNRPAAFATGILGTSALWVAFSQVSVTDLPMSAAYATGMLMGLRWLSTGDRRWVAGAAVLFGLAVTAKGLVPLALILPLLWMGRRRLGDWIRPFPLLGFVAVALPWYFLCGMENGRPFVDEFFVRHHFTRFTSGVLLHPRPFWFYIPVLVFGVHPWTALLPSLFRRGLYSDTKRRFLLLWVGFGFVFFSASTGKLPGYILPLLPAIAALAGIALDEMKDARWLLSFCCLALAITPVVAQSLPGALATGLSRTPVSGWSWGFAALSALGAGAVWWAEREGKRNGAAGLLLICITLSVVALKTQALPEVDRLASARILWRTVSANPGQVCVENIHRNWRYSLNYYSVTPLPECSQTPRPAKIRQVPGAPPFVELP